jgi:hypothetical protein
LYRPLANADPGRYIARSVASLGILLARFNLEFVGIWLLVIASPIGAAGLRLEGV